MRKKIVLMILLHLYICIYVKTSCKFNNTINKINMSCFYLNKMLFVSLILLLLTGLFSTKLIN